MNRKTVLTAALLLGLTSAAQAQTWNIDASHSSAQFAVRHMMVSTVRGTMGKITGTVTINGKDLATASVNAAIDVAGINTGVEQRDTHLKSPDFFDVAKYPSITFTSTKITPRADGSFSMAGNLTMHGTTKAVTLEVEAPRQPIKDQSGKMRSGTTATTKINRQDFGVKWSQIMDGGGVVVSDEVSITIDVELVQAAA
jgi:polyisoprenoid-binding protein YceI